jgi:hypothetical protein
MPSACGYSRSVVGDVLGLIGMAVFIAIIVALAAGVTWIVVRLSPPANGKQPGG